MLIHYSEGNENSNIINYDKGNIKMTRDEK